MDHEFHRHVFGLDISDRSLRLIKLAKHGKKITISAHNEVKIPAGVIVSGVIMKEATLLPLIAQLITTAKGEKIPDKTCIADLPESKTFVKVITTKTSAHKLDAITVKNEIPNHIPVNPDEIYFDWQIIEQQANATTLLIGAAPRPIVDTYLELLQKNGLEPHAFEIEAAAILRCCLKPTDQKPRVVIDFGAMRSGLILYDHGTVQFTASLPISGTSITKTIATTLAFDLTKAEKAKRVCGLDPKKCEGALRKILTSSVDKLALQIKKALQFYSTTFTDTHPIEEILLCGGGANFLSIDTVLSEKLKLPVAIANPFTNVVPATRLNLPRSKALSYTTAIGLALRVFDDAHLL